ncbi:MAG: hypothetical protein KDB88_01465 [Flavobacteriales bacterium]|nr:hypothetical protein [Flavobacteriales bacterium]
MSVLEFRPRFRFVSPMNEQELLGRIKDHVQGTSGHGLLCRRSRSQLTLRFEEKLRHAWTPQLDIHLEKETEGTLVRCLIGPAPNIWMLFTGGYLFWSFVAVVGIALGVSQQTVNEDPWGYWLLIPSALGPLVMVWMSLEGKRRSRDEMRTLNRTVDEALGCDCFRLAMEQDANAR